MTTYTRSERRQPTYGAMFSIDAIKRANQESGYHYFSEDTVRFFGSRVLSDVIGGRFFITSERRGFDASSGRGFSVREFMPDGSIADPCEFGEFDTAAQARSAARRLSKETHSYYFANAARGKNSRTYVVTGATDPWHAMKSLPRNFNIGSCGRVQDYMTADKGYDVREAKA